jgi:hypothetical protein
MGRRKNAGIYSGYRTFGGKSYKLWNKYTNKRDANIAVNFLRNKRGYFARIIKRKRIGSSVIDYIVYYRKK